MVSFFTLIPLLFATSANANNDLYPTYQYSIHIESEGYIPSTPLVVYRTNASSPTPFYTSISYLINGDVYFNQDSNDFYIPNFKGTCHVDFSSYDSDNDEFDLEDSFDFDLFDINVSSHGADLGVSGNFKLNFTNPFTYTLTYTSPLNISNSQNKSITGNYTVPTYASQNPVSFSFDDSDVLDNISMLISNYVSNGYNLGFDNGYNSGYSNGLDDGLSSGYQQGYGDGFNEASAQNSVAVTIFAGICEVGLLPVNVFLGILNFEVFGINIGGFVASLMTIAVVVIVIRIVLGAKSKE